jgi:hypothetical protein
MLQYLPLFLFVIIFLGVPYTITTWQAYDDALFIKLAESISQGNWLGTFDYLTLVKGPGYPIFLAVNNFFGLNVVLSQAMFWGLVLLLFFKILVVEEKSRLAFAICFSIAILDPRVFQLDHPFRETIYTSQALAVLGILIYGFLPEGKLKIPSGRKFVALLGGGMLFAWFWLTREEGIWLLPGIFLLILYFFIRSRQDGKVKIFLRKIFIWTLGFGMIYCTFLGLNLSHYNSFSGVDATQKDFTRSVRALQSIQVGEKIPYVSITKEMRIEAYEVSSEFSSLREFLDPVPNNSPWIGALCTLQESTCGDISDAVFQWAYRQAVFYSGNYTSPVDASEFFENVAEQIEAACFSKKIVCGETQNLVPLMPNLTSNSLDRIPGSLTATIRSITSAHDVPKESRGYGGDPGRFSEILSYLGNPTHFPLEKTTVRELTFFEKFSSNSRNVLSRFYGYFIPLSFFLVFPAIFLTLFSSKFRKKYHLELIVGASLFLSAFFRCLILIAVDVTSFPSITIGYLNASYSLFLISTLILGKICFEFVLHTWRVRKKEL